MVLRIHRGASASSLASALADVLAVPLADPFTAEVVSVPARGVERWLTQRLSLSLGSVDADGISANIEFPSPAALVENALASVRNVDPDDEPWSRRRMLWETLTLIDESIDQPWCSVLAAHLGNGTDEHRAGRRWSTAAHLTDLFGSYAADRPAMITDWAAGVDSDGLGGTLPVDQQWQAELWRSIRARIGSPSPAELLESSCVSIAANPGLLDLPDRLSIFGATRLTTDQLRVVAALSGHRDVHLWIPHPSEVMWNKLTEQKHIGRRRDDRSALALEHPLLSSLARDVRELQSRILGIDATVEHTVGPADSYPSTLLGCVQSDIAYSRKPVRSAVPDGTIAVHACHGAPRQVEVLRECLLHLFDGDPTLEPRDVLVMCPDVETYAPLVRAAFGQGGLGHPGHKLRVRLADRGLRQTNPLLAVVATVLDLAVGRVTASQVLDLAASGPVRTRFGFGDDDLERLREWVQVSGARWGINSRQRSRFGLGDFAQNTFNFAMDRLLLGVAADETSHEWLDLALPVDDVDGNDIDLTGRLAEFLDRLAVVLRDLQGPQKAAEWQTALVRALDLLTDTDAADQWQRAQALRELADSTRYGDEVVLRLSDVRAMLTRALAGRPSRANFRTGELTVCTMVPMRSVPHRVVVLLGLDDEVYPRAGSLDGDNVLTRDPAIGERDVRSEDRQLLLDAVMSAEQKLLLFYTGADPVSGMVKPPAIPLTELLDVIRTTADADIVQRHPLQPFDARNFDPRSPFSYDRAALDGARAIQREPAAPPPFLPGVLPPAQPGDIELRDLIAFVEHPIAAFLKQRLGIRVPDLDDDVSDSLTVELDGLQKWDIGDRMLAERLAGTAVADFRAAEWRRGTLPPFGLGDTQLQDITRAVEALFEVSRDVHAGESHVLDVSIQLSSGRRVTGTVTGIHGNTIARTSYSRLAPKHRLAAWVRVLAARAQDQSTAWQALTTGRGPGRRAAWRSTITAPVDALDLLEKLVELRDLGLASPLPMGPTASAAYAERRFRGTSAELAMDAAAKQWNDKFGDITDRSIAYVHGRSPEFMSVRDAAFGEGVPRWGDETTAFGALSCHLWCPLLDAETEGQP
ncbi:exodeoxyribonuclease V subunit gamma [Rhodococcus sp. G-MC3]|uniref:exodeoxyribonuclease V subunit gamma n=1 Tax=Rhodococcus sp. G-MC3 TaxID=3046209 RepID=UPI0024B8CF57|nr:exodeoxyribonuclease V subunit gamma [Rhodococcus sp. G-MC3]MDJ0396085.1 exodeoxyribonuclease V subunit gamma [Rhodococcus sp. G-MC3]